MRGVAVDLKLTELPDLVAAPGGRIQGKVVLTVQLCAVATVSMSRLYSSVRLDPLSLVPYTRVCKAAVLPVNSSAVWSSPPSARNAC